MKYIKYIGTILWTIIRKTIGIPMFYIVVWFRAYARNTVYNYVLDNDTYLKRLLERPIRKYNKSYVIGAWHGSKGGTISRKDVSWLEYQLAYWCIWGWLDDDAYCDTTSKVWIEEHIDNRRDNLGNSYADAERCLTKCNGNSFDRGDSLEPNICGWLTFNWVMRNSAYNFKYMQYEKCSSDKDIFLVTIFGYQFGWKPDQHEPKNCSLVIFEKENG